MSQGKRIVNKSQSSLGKECKIGQNKYFVTQNSETTEELIGSQA